MDDGGSAGPGGPGPGGPRVPQGDGSLPVVRLTGRGAILALLVLSFAGILVSDWLGWGLLADVTFVAACVVIACYAKPSDLLAVSVCPPLAFFVACVLAKLITSTGGTAAAEGTLVTLATSAPWLFLGTAVTIVIALRRGLLDNIRELRHGLQETAGRGGPGPGPEHHGPRPRAAFEPGGGLTGGTRDVNPSSSGAAGHPGTCFSSSDGPRPSLAGFTAAVRAPS